MPLCVECGDDTDSLYVEYSEGNLRLTRCDSCGQICDKYIEYELILVLIDIVLHRKAAYRHLYHNRRDFWPATNSVRWLIIVVICLNALFKAIVLHKRQGTLRIFQLIAASSLEHAALVVGFAVVLVFIPSSKYSAGIIALN